MTNSPQTSFSVVKNWKHFFLKSRTKIKFPLLPLLFNIVLEVLVTAINGSFFEYGQSTFNWGWKFPLCPVKNIFLSYFKGPPSGSSHVSTSQSVRCCYHSTSATASACPPLSLPEEPLASISEAFTNGLYREGASPLGPRAGPGNSQTILSLQPARIQTCKNLTVCNESSLVLQHQGSDAIQGAWQERETTSPSSLLFSPPHHPWVS